VSDWKFAPLASVATIERSSIQPENIENDTLYVGLEHIISGGELMPPQRVQNGDLASSKFRFTQSHILYGKLRPYLAKIARPDFAGICSTDILPILPSNDLDRRFLLHFLRQPAMVQRANNEAVGANLPRISPTTLGSFKVPLPPLAEQRHIADILDKADALRAQRRAALAELDTLTQSIFLDLFGDPARNTKRLPTTTLGHLGKWQSGGTPSRAKEAFFSGSIPWFSSGELEGGYIFASKEHISETALRETSARRVPSGSLMLGMYDTAALKAAIAGIDCSCNQAIAFSTIAPKLAETIYVYSAIVLGREDFRRLQRGVRQKNLNLSMIRDIRIPLPPLKMQQDFARRITAIETLKSRHRTALAELDTLFASLQHRAFRGEL